MQKNTVQNESLHPSEYKTSSRDFDKASNVPSKKEEDHLYRISEERTSKRSARDSNFVQTIPDFSKTKQTYEENANRNEIELIVGSPKNPSLNTTTQQLNFIAKSNNFESQSSSIQRKRSENKPLNYDKKVTMVLTKNQD